MTAINMKFAICVTLGMAALGCARAPSGTGEVPGSNLDSLEPSTSAEATRTAAPKVIPPENAVTAPDGVQETVAELAARKGELGTTFDEHPESNRSKARGGRAIGACRRGSAPNFECGTDADCGSGRSCLCRPSGKYSQCVPADCRTDADCAGGQCVEALQRRKADLQCSTVSVALHCTSNRDECVPGPDACGGAEGVSCLFSTDDNAFVCAQHCTEARRMQPGK